MTSDWPAIHFRTGLQLNNTLGHGLYIIENFLNQEDLQAWKEFTASLNMIFPSSARPLPGHAFRNNGRVKIEDQEFAERLWNDSGLKKLITMNSNLKEVNGRNVVGLNSNFRLYKYLQNNEFGPHYDESDCSNGATSEYTILLYLGDDDLVGGETRFHVGKKERIDIECKGSRMLLHRHGDDCLLHEGMKVIKGTKWVLRTDLMYE